MKIDIIAGARPNFMKIAPIIEAFQKLDPDHNKISYRLIHTGQHYDKSMSENFFTQLGIPHPDINLECGSGTQAEQTSNIMIAFEKDLVAHPADLVLVVGDVTSTMACSIVAKKLGVKVAHVEAGIRSFDLSMPEEINRMVTDAITDYFFTTSVTANENLQKAGIEEDRIYFVGNTMIDTLYKNLNNFKEPKEWETIGLKKKQYFVVTLHRPANVDDDNKIEHLLSEIVNSVNGLPVIFPVHPRTKKVLERIDFGAPNLHLIDPLGYLEFNYLVLNAMAVITDSGGITEETTFMKVPCITLRETTERPETIFTGSNELIGTDGKLIRPMLHKVIALQWKKSGIPDLWDGKASERIAEILLKISSTF
jgi:UDP-N-acetylglucosamine 2-epimerase (non-hydrolysing)